MKRIPLIAVIAILLLLCSCSSVNDKEETPSTAPYIDTEPIPTANEGDTYLDLFPWPTFPPETESKSSDKSDYEDNWDRPAQIYGIETTCIAGSSAFLCNVPEFTEQHDNTVEKYYITEDRHHIFVTATYAGNPADKLEDVFQNNLDWIMERYEYYRGDHNNYYAAEIVTEEVEEINGRQMLYMRGNLHYESFDEDYTWRVLGYATELSNGEYAMMIASYYEHTPFLELKDDLDNMAWSFEEVS